MTNQAVSVLLVGQAVEIAIRDCLVEQDLGIAGVQFQRFRERVERLARAAGVQVNKRLAEDGVWRLGVACDGQLRVLLRHCQSAAIMRELVFAHIGKRDSCVAQRKVRLAIQCLLILLQGLVKPAVVRLSSQFFGVGEDLIDGGAQPGQFVLVPPLMRFLGNAEQFGGGGGGFLGMRASAKRFIRTEARRSTRWRAGSSSSSVRASAAPLRETVSTRLAPNAAMTSSGLFGFSGPARSRGPHDQQILDIRFCAHQARIYAIHDIV